MTGRQLVDAAEQDALPRLGFYRRRGMFRLHLEDGVEGQIGLNTGNIAKGTVSVHPFISVRHDNIEQEVNERAGDGGDRSATIVAHLGEVGVRDVPDLIVADEASAREVLDFIVDRLERYGIPWMHEMATLEGLAAGLGRYRAIAPYLREAIAYRRSGDPVTALAILDRDLEWFAGADTGQSASFRRLAASLRPELVAEIAARDGDGDGMAR